MAPTGRSQNQLKQLKVVTAVTEESHINELELSQSMLGNRKTAKNPDLSPCTEIFLYTCPSK